MTGLSLRQVSKRFGRVAALDDVSFDLSDGELLAVVGPSGCGKTTLLRLIAGLESADAGRICLAGRDLAGVPPKDRDVAMVFQNHVLYPQKTVRGNLAFGLELRRLARAEIARRVAEAAEILGIGELLDRRPHQLSGGQQQRVALGRAIVRRPQLFLFDEPLSSLDAALRGQLRRDIAALHRRLGTTMICVTHDQAEAMTLGQRIAVLCAGRLQQIADPPTLYRCPANRFVAAAVGSPAMNFVDGMLRQRDGGLVFLADAAGLPDEDRVTSIVGDAAQRWAALVERRLTLGIRPEDFHVATAAGPGAARWRAVVESVECLGPETHVACVVGPLRLLVRADRDTCPRLGECVWLHWEPQNAQLFDAATGEAIRPGPTAA